MYQSILVLVRVFCCRSFHFLSSKWYKTRNVDLSDMSGLTYTVLMSLMIIRSQLPLWISSQQRIFFSIQDKIYYLTIHSSGLQITIMLAGHLMAHSWLVYNTPTSQSCCGRLCRYCQHILGYTGHQEAQAHSAKCFRALRDSRPQRNADCHPSPLRWTQREVWANWDKYRLVW